MALPDGAAQAFADVIRVTQCDVNGIPYVGAPTYTSDTLVQLVTTPVVTTGVDLEQQNAAGDLAATIKHGDMIRYETIALSLVRPDPVLEQMLAGGVVLGSSAAALTAPTAPTQVAAATGGTLPTASNQYAVSAVNLYGETTATPAAAPIAVTGPTGQVTVTWTAVSGAIAYNVYGRTPGGPYQLIASNVTGLSYIDTGVITPTSPSPVANTTAGPGSAAGYQAPALRSVGLPNNFISIELWCKAVVNGVQASFLPYWRWVIPGVKNLRRDARTFSNTILANPLTGQAFENPNWGSGPFGDWPYDSTKVSQRVRVGRAGVPTVGLSAVPATF